MPVKRYKKRDYPVAAIQYTGDNDDELRDLNNANIFWNKDGMPFLKEGDVLNPIWRNAFLMWDGAHWQLVDAFVFSGRWEEVPDAEGT